MASIHSKLTKTTALLSTYLFFIGFFVAGCAYRLTNLHIQNPSDIETIAVEAIFDTGGQVIPHEVLWDQLQRAFAANGHLKIASAKTADALLRAHIRKTSIDKVEFADLNPNNERKDPEIYAGRSDPPAPGALRDLTVASKFYNKDSTTFIVDVEVWNLESHKLMLQRSYTGSTLTQAVRVTDLQDVVLLRHDEALDRGLNTVAKQIAETVVTDLLVR